MKSNRQHAGMSGFTLLEVMAALLLMAVIISMVFAIARTSLRLSKAIVDKQNEEMMQQAFFDLLGRRFASLPGNTRMDVTVDGSSPPFISDMTLQNVPMSFTWGGEDRLAKAVQLSTVMKRSGYLDIVLRYYEDEVLEGSESSFGSSSVDAEEPFAEIVLMSDVRDFEWRLLNAATMEWQYEWADRSRLPLQLELLISLGAEGEMMRHVFWLPPKQNPELVMRQINQGKPGGAGSQGGAQPPNSINVELPGSGQQGGGR